MAHLTTMTWIYSNIFVVMEMAPAFRLSSLHAGRKTCRQSSASHIHSRELMQTVFISSARNSCMIFQKVSCQRSSKWISPSWLTKNSCKTEAERKGRACYRNKYKIDSYRMDKWSRKQNSVSKEHFSKLSRFVDSRQRASFKSHFKCVTFGLE